MMEPYETNEERVVEFMNYSRNGGLSQAFVIHAISAYAQNITRLGLPALRAKLPSMMSAESWYDCAFEWIESNEPKAK